MSEIKNFFLVEDTDDSLKSKSAGKFGLNTGVNITKIEFLADGGKDGAPADAVDIWGQIGEKEYRRRLYVTTGDLYGPNNSKVSPGDEKYPALLAADMGQKVAVLKHVLKAVGVTAQAINQVSAGLSMDAIADGMKKLAELAPANYKTNSVDIFLEYQWDISEGATRKFVEIPKNMKGGAFACAAVKPVGKWNEVINEEGLHYKDDANNIHPIARSAEYMLSKKAIQEGEGAETPAAGGVQDTPKSTTW